MSAAWEHLRNLQPGDPVPSDLYVLDYRDGKRPRWRVREVEELPSGGRAMTLEDPDNGADEILGTATPVCLQVITSERRTLRTRPYLLGLDPQPTLCDMDQQGRNAARRAARLEELANDA